MHSPAVGHDVGVRLLLPKDFDRQPGQEVADPLSVARLLRRGHRLSQLDQQHRCGRTVGEHERPDRDAGGGRCRVLLELADRAEVGDLPPHRATQAASNASTGLATSAPSPGLSMGGFGALTYAAPQPRLLPRRRVLQRCHRTRPTRARADGPGPRHRRAYGADPLALWGDPVARRAIWAAHNPYRPGHGSCAGCGCTCPPATACPGRSTRRTPPTTASNSSSASRPVAVAKQLRANGVRVQTDFYGPGRHAWAVLGEVLHRSFPMPVRRST